MTSVINLFRIAVVGLLLPAAINSHAQSVNTQLRSQIEAWTDTIAAKAKEMDIERDPGAIGDSYIYLQKMEAFQELRAAMLQQSKTVFADIESYARDEYVKSLIVFSLREMPTDEYVAFLDRALELTKDGKLSHQLMGWALHPAAGQNRTLLIDSYDNERVRAVMLKAKEVFAADPEFVAGLDKRLSGRAKLERDDFVYRSTGMPSKANPKLPGSTPAVTPVPSTPATPTTLQPPSTPTAETAAAPIERKAPVWPWVVGILALFVIVAVALKRRA